MGSFILATFLFASIPAQAEKSITDINQEIEQQRSEINKLRDQISTYQNKIKSQQKETSGIGNQLAILENQVAKVELDIKATEAEIDQANLEIQKVSLEIKESEKKIKDQQQKLGEYLRLLHQKDDTTYLEVLLANDSFSDFFDYLQSIEQIQGQVQGSLEKVKQAKTRLEIEKGNLEEKRRQEEGLKTKLVIQKSELDERRQAQEILHIQSRLTERQYQNQLYQLQLEQQQINADIANLEKQAREELERRRREQDKKPPSGPARLGWPVDATRGITTYFHDPDYPFRHIFEHPGLDIRAAQGTPIAAPESGYVAKVKFAGDTSYAYIMLVHNDGFSSVFGHVSRVNVQEDDFVTKGQIVGATGGRPGSVGAGALTTGPHLHFEVRLNGIPVNPLDYLPAL